MRCRDVGEVGARVKVFGRLAPIQVNFIPLETVSRGETSERDRFARTVPKNQIFHYNSTFTGQNRGV